MFKLWKSPARLLTAALVTGFVSLIPLFGANFPVPGTLNYVEGQAAVDGKQLSPKSVGSTVISPNNVLETRQGKTEILLTPGVFLRLGDNSSVRMLAAGLTDTRLELQRGEAILEVNDLHKENNLRVMADGATLAIKKKGLYELNADNHTAAIYDGEALVSKNDYRLKLKKGKETSLAGELKATKFDRKAPDPLYAWSRLRSEYESRASNQYARSVLTANSPWWGPGWYWNPYWDTYGFIPGYGIMYSPFGWGFPSPLMFAPYYGYGFAPIYRSYPGHWGRLGGASPNPGAFHGGTRRRR